MTNQNAATFFAVAGILLTCVAAGIGEKNEATDMIIAGIIFCIIGMLVALSI